MFILDKLKFQFYLGSSEQLHIYDGNSLNVYSYDGSFDLLGIPSDHIAPRLHIYRINLLIQKGMIPDKVYVYNLRNIPQPSE